MVEFVRWRAISMNEQQKEKLNFVSNMRYQNIELCIRGDIQFKYLYKSIISWSKSYLAGDIPSGISGFIMEYSDKEMCNALRNILPTYNSGLNKTISL